MALTLNDVRDIADYARIALTSEELDQMCAYLNDAIRLLQPIRAYDLDGVEPTFHPIGNLSNVMKGDEVDPHGRTLSLDEALHGASSVQDRFFRVPSILADETAADETGDL